MKKTTTVISSVLAKNVTAIAFSSAMCLLAACGGGGDAGSSQFGPKPEGA